MDSDVHTAVITWCNFEGHLPRRICKFQLGARHRQVICGYLDFVHTLLPPPATVLCQVHVLLPFVEFR